MMKNRCVPMAQRTRAMLRGLQQMAAHGQARCGVGCRHGPWHMGEDLGRILRGFAYDVGTPSHPSPHLQVSMLNRTVYFISDGTGITAETFGNSILAQFAIKPRHVRPPFIDTVHQVVREINHPTELEGRRSIVFVTLVDSEILKILKSQCKGMVLDMFN